MHRMHKIDQFVCVLDAFDVEPVVLERGYPIARTAANFEVEAIRTHCLEQECASPSVVSSSLRRQDNNQR